MRRYLQALVTLGVCVTAAPAAVPRAQTSVSPGVEAVPLVLPARRPPDARPAGPPDLPAGLERITPLTITAALRRVATGGRPQTVQQTITRTVDRIHLATSDKREWLFERNPVDPRRVSGLLVEHTARTIVMYAESDLRVGLGLRGWGDVLSLGFDPGLLNRLTPSGRTRTLGGIEFAHYAGTSRAQEVWWSAAQGFASSFVITDAAVTTTVSVERVSRDFNASVLEAPSVRFPSYRLIDLTEWQEHR